MKLAYKLFNRINDSDFEYFYCGEFSQVINERLLDLAETNVRESASKTSLKNRIYFVMVEGLQNITRHGNKETDSNNDNSGMFAIQKSDDQYLVTTGNTLKSKEADLLRIKIEQINNLEKEQLKKLRKAILLNGKLSEKGGAGLGLIEMARKSGKKLMFDFEKVTDETSFFYFRTEIPDNKLIREVTVPTIINDSSINDIKGVHRILKKKNILINFNGRFNRHTILNLLSVIKGRMSVSLTARKVHAIMVEMLQNISKHTNEIDEIKRNRGIFYMRIKNNCFVLTSGNYMNRKETAELKKMIAKMNLMNREELFVNYDRILLDADSVSAQKTGLGFIDMRIKSGNKLKFSFKNLNKDLSFFTLQAKILIK